jgi:hypothetical protein
MKSRFKTAAIILLTAVLLFDPFALGSGIKDEGPYSKLITELERHGANKFLFIASYDDYFDTEFNNWMQSVFDNRYSDNSYQQVLVNASLGQKHFLRFLNKSKIEYLITPSKTANSGRIYHRFGKYGEIKINLHSFEFQKVTSTGGNYPLTLYKIQSYPVQTPNQETPSYSFEWFGARKSFSQIVETEENNKITKIKNYSYFYEDGEKVSYVLDGEKPKLIFHTSRTEEKFQVNVTLGAAYGENASPQVLIVTHNNIIKTLLLKAGPVSSLSFEVNDGSIISFESRLPCRSPMSFDPDNGGDPRKLCFFIESLSVSVN